MDQLHTQAYYSRETLLANKCGREQGSKNEKKEKQYQKKPEQTQKKPTHIPRQRKNNMEYMLYVFSL